MILENKASKGVCMKIQIEKTYERDIDLLIIEEFISNKDFAEIFLGKTTDYVIENVIHSKIDGSFGESDVVIIINQNGKRHALHVEDKIDAIAMEEQHARYHKRAQNDIAKGEYDTYSVYIVAPEKYLDTNKEASKYERKIKYEELRDYFASKKDLRSKYKLALIDKAIEEQKNGYQWEANVGVVDFCSKMNVYKKSKFPGLPDGTIAWWSGYPTKIKGATIVFKANKGFCDLQFSNTTELDLLERVKNHISTKMSVVKAGKSASIRMKVTPINFENKFEDETEKVDEALSALWELFELSNELNSTSVNINHNYQP